MLWLETNDQGNGAQIMYAGNSINQTIKHTLGTADSLDLRAAKLFESAYRNPHKNPIQRLFARQSEPLLELRQVACEKSALNRHFAGTQAVAMTNIQGSIDRTTDFDRDFRPIQRHTELRWQRIATAMLRGQALPPVELVRIGDTYFVKDGHHRISVARQLGFSYIDAVIEEWGDDA
jgi:hypothetical protein